MRANWKLESTPGTSSAFPIARDLETLPFPNAILKGVKRPLKGFSSSFDVIV
jgi:hypothetical protein